MDVVVTDANGRDIMFIHDFELDVAFGAEENDFEITIPEGSTQELENGSMWYVDGSDIGGIIDGVAYDFDRFGKVVKYTGRTWQGILAHKIIAPPKGQAYYRAKGDAHSIINQLLEELGLTNRLSAPESDSGIMIDYQFPRYVDAYAGIVDMLMSVNSVLKIESGNGRVVLSAVKSEPCKLYAEKRAFSIKRTLRCTNHLICLGIGQLQARVVEHLFADAFGNVTKKQHFFGTDEVVEVYDDNNSEKAELIENGTKKLKELQIPDDIALSIDDDDLNLDIGSIVIAEDNDVVVSGIVTKKVIRKERGITTYQYTIGSTIASS